MYHVFLTGPTTRYYAFNDLIDFGLTVDHAFVSTTLPLDARHREPDGEQSNMPANVWMGLHGGVAEIVNPLDFDSFIQFGRLAYPDHHTLAYYIEDGATYVGELVDRYEPESFFSLDDAKEWASRNYKSTIYPIEEWIALKSGIRT